jgi:NADPH:quinone reductase-like Zn-dependent oxidoreductase
MKALMKQAYGPLETSVRIEDVPIPKPAADEVRIRVRYAGVNPIDWKLIEGQHKWLARSNPPCGVGFELAGEVHEQGADGRLPRGARVVGLIPAFRRPPAAYAQFALVPLSFVVKLPDAVPLEQAAALPVAGLSALRMCELARIERGRRVLIHGAGGGVGHLALQIARNLGAEVTASGSPSGGELFRKLRPSRVVDRASPVEQWGGPFDAVLDCASTLTSEQLQKLVASDGHVVATAARFPRVIADTLLNLVRPGKRRVLMVRPDARALARLMQLLAAGHLTVHVQHAFALDRAVQALETSRAGHVCGKLVIAVE